MLRWVTIEKFSAESGYTPDAVRSKIKRGDWLEGQVWIKARPAGFLLIQRDMRKALRNKRNLERTRILLISAAGRESTHSGRSRERFRT